MSMYYKDTYTKITIFMYTEKKKHEIDYFMNWNEAQN